MVFGNLAHGFSSTRFVLFAIGFFATDVVATPPIQAADMRPFTAYLTESPAAENDRAKASRSIYARRSDGSWSHVYEGENADGTKRTVIEFLDVAKAVFVHSEPVTESIMTRHISAAQIPQEVTAGISACDGSEAQKRSERSTMLGYRVVRIETKEKSSREVSWVVPELACYPLRSIFTNSSFSNETTVTAIIEGEPAAEFFTAPTGYVERSPAEVEALYRKKIPGSRLFADDAEMIKVDEIYRASQLNAQ